MSKSARGHTEPRTVNPRRGVSDSSPRGRGPAAIGKGAVSAADAPKAIGPYSHAIRAGELLFISGQVPIDPLTGNLIDGDITAQTRRVMDNLAAVLKAGGLSFQQVVRTTIFLADMSDFTAVNAVYGSFFSEPYPARATVQVSRLPKDARVEIDAIASYS